MRKLRVLTILHELSLTGAPKIGINACQEMNGDVETFFLAMRGGPQEDLCRKTGSLHIVPEDHQNLGGRVLTRPGSLARRVWMTAKESKAKYSISRLEKQLKAWQPDVIYVNSVVSLRLFESIGLPAVPVLLHVHELDVIIKLGLGDSINLLTTKPDKYIAVAEPVKRLLIDRFAIPESRIALVHEFVPDADFYQHVAEPEEARDDCFVVGGAGQPGWRKGTTLWLQTAVELKTRMGAKVRFVWVGIRDDDHGTFFQEEARKFRIHDSIDFIPVTSTPLQYYALFDVFAMTSYEDPCPLVVLENMMLKKPVFCFAGSGGAAEEVGPTGVVIDDFSPYKMAEAIASLAEMPERRSALGEAARARVEERFLASRQVPKILAELKALTNR